MICSKCGSLISVSENEVGKTAVCPQCGNVQQVENTPMECTCSACGQSLEVEAWMEGETAECPACQQPTVLRRAATAAEAAVPAPAPAPTPAAGTPPVPHFRTSAHVSAASAPAPAQTAASAPSFRGTPAPSPAVQTPLAAAAQANQPAPAAQAELQAPDPALFSDCMSVISIDRSAAAETAQVQPREFLEQGLHFARRYAVQIGTVLFALVLLFVIGIVKDMFRLPEVKDQSGLIQMVKDDDAETLKTRLKALNGSHRKATIAFLLQNTNMQKNRSQKVLTMLLKEKLVSPADPQLFWLRELTDGQHEWIGSALQESETGFNVQLHDGSTILENAVIAGACPPVEKLLSSGADPNVADHSGRPLIFSTLHDPQMLELFLKNGANLNVRDYDMNTPLCAAAILGQQKSVMLLLAGMQDASQVNDAGDTALTILLASGKKIPSDILKRLLAIPCGINVKNKQGKDALALVMEQQQYELAVELLHAGAKAPANLTASVKDDRWKETLENTLAQLKTAPVQGKSASAKEKEILPIYGAAKPLEVCWVCFAVMLVWVGAGLFGAARFAFPGDRLLGRCGNVLMLVFGPVMLAVQLILRLYQKFRFRLYLFAQQSTMGKADDAIRFCRLDGSECDFPGDEGAEPKADAFRIVTALLKKGKKTILLSPDPKETKVVLQGGESEDVTLFAIEKGRSRKLIRFFKKLADLNPLEEAKPQCGRLQFILDGIPYFVSLSTIGMGGNGERAILTVRKGDVPVQKFADLLLSSQDRTSLDAFLAGSSGLLAVMAPEGSGRRTFISLLLDECAVRGMHAVWIGNGTEPAGAPEVPRVKADLAAGVTFRQMLQALSDYPVVAISFNGNTMPSKEIFELAAGKLVILMVDAAGSAGIKKLLTRGATAQDMQSVLRLVVRPWPVQKLCDCAVDDVPGVLLSRAWSVLGEGHAKKSAGCAECGHTGAFSSLVLYEFNVPENDRMISSPFPAWNAARVQAALLAMQGKIAAAEAEKVLKGDC